MPVPMQAFRYSIIAWRLEFVNIGLPVFPIELLNMYAPDGRGIQAPDVHTYPFRVRPGNIKRLDTTCFAKQVLRLMGIERIGLQILFAREQAKSILRYDQVQITGFRANGAITLGNLQVFRRFNLELDRATVASSSVYCHRTDSLLSLRRHEIMPSNRRQRVTTHTRAEVRSTAMIGPACPFQVPRLCGS
jgi:hypothetical protein